MKNKPTSEEITRKKEYVRFLTTQIYLKMSTERIGNQENKEVIHGNSVLKLIFNWYYAKEKKENRGMIKRKQVKNSS